MADLNSIFAKSQTDWSKCCLCQKYRTDTDLTSPRTTYTLEHDGYAMLATNIPVFHEIHAMPLFLDPARLDEGGGIDATLRRNQAKYHLSCRLLFNNTKLDRARKRQSAGPSSEPENVQAKQWQKSCDVQACIFCERIEPDLRQIMIMHLNQRLHRHLTMVS